MRLITFTDKPFYFWGGFIMNNEFEYYRNKYIELSLQQGKPIPYSKLTENGLKDGRWYIKNNPKKDINTFSKFVYSCGFVVPKLLTKEYATELIFKKQNDYNRPLKYDDFRCSGCYDVTIPCITKIWGSVNKMKEELGLEIIQESMIDKIPSKKDFDFQLSYIINILKDEERDFITTSEIDGNKALLNYDTLNKYSKKYYKRDFKDLLFDNGINIGTQGRGITYTFPDGEKITSQFEYIFSKYLKDNGYIFNDNYFRDVKYSSFIPNYNGMKNCDYVIRTSNFDIYIEIAGVLQEYKNSYYNDLKILSDSKNRYRESLKYKESLLKDNGMIYFILFPCDLTNENFNKILSNPTDTLRNDIEKFNHHNLDWKKIRKNGYLDYSDKTIIRNTKAWADSKIQERGDSIGEQRKSL